MDFTVFLKVVFGYLVGLIAAGLLIWWAARQFTQPQHRRVFVAAALVVLAGSLIAVTYVGLYPYTSRPDPLPASTRLILARPGYVQGLRASDGAALWSSALGGVGMGGGENVTMSGAMLYAVGTPPIASSPPSPTSLFALRASDGQMVWHRPLPLDRSSGPEACRGFGRLGVLAAENTVYSCYGTTLYAFRGTDGHLIWSLAASKIDPSGAELEAVTAGDGELFLLFAGKAPLVALSATNGSVVWQTTQYHAGELALDGQTLFISDYSYSSLSAVRVQDGSPVWTTVHESPYSVYHSLLAVGNRVYVEGYGIPGRGGCAFACWGIDAYNAQTGALLWHSQDDFSDDGGGGLLVGAGNTVYAFSVSDNLLVAVRASDGSTAWQYQPNYGGFLFVQPAAQGGVLIPSIVDGVLFLPIVANTGPYRFPRFPQDAITALNAQTGSHYWTQPVPMVNFEDVRWLGVSG